MRKGHHKSLLLLVIWCLIGSLPRWGMVGSWIWLGVLILLAILLGSRKKEIPALFFIASFPAGRLIKEGDKSYSYGWLDKVLSVTENGQQIARFNYHNDGQIAQAIHNGKSEDFLWDGLALIHRGETSFINEPYVTGGNPILSSKDGVMFNDMLGSTLNIGGKAVNMTAFGESADSNAMYTGKPYIGELGYAFLFRNYRSDYGKWQTTDPLGYPDGWNNLAYCNNEATIAIDGFGLSVWQWTKETLAALSYGVLYICNGAASLPPGNAVKWFFGPGTIPTGITSLYTAAAVQNMDSVTKNIDSYYNSAITQFNNKSSIGTYNLSSRHYYVSNRKALDKQQQHND